MGKNRVPPISSKIIKSYNLKNQEASNDYVNVNFVANSSGCIPSQKNIDEDISYHRLEIENEYLSEHNRLLRNELIHMKSNIDSLRNVVYNQEVQQSNLLNERDHLFEIIQELQQNLHWFQENLPFNILSRCPFLHPSGGSNKASSLKSFKKSSFDLPSYDSRRSFQDISKSQPYRFVKNLFKFSQGSSNKSRNKWNGFENKMGSSSENCFGSKELASNACNRSLYTSFPSRNHLTETGFKNKSQDSIKKLATHKSLSGLQQESNVIKKLPENHNNPLFKEKELLDAIIFPVLQTKKIPALDEVSFSVHSVPLLSMPRNKTKVQVIERENSNDSSTIFNSSEGSDSSPSIKSIESPSKLDSFVSIDISNKNSLSIKELPKPPKRSGSLPPLRTLSAESEDNQPLHFLKQRVQLLLNPNTIPEHPQKNTNNLVSRSNFNNFHNKKESFTTLVASELHRRKSVRLLPPLPSSTLA